MNNEITAKKGILYLVPTPVGNLGDMTYRAVEILNKVELIACEDTRTSLKLLNHYSIKKKLISYHKFNERRQTAPLLRVLLSGHDIAVITDAGTPGISDPASIIVKSALENDITITCLPGATALIPALAASGLDSDAFTFTGFLPAKKKDRTALIERMSELPHTIIIYAASHDIISTLTELANRMGERNCVLAREISKMHESYYRGTLSQLAQQTNLETRGEFVLLIAGKPPKTITDTEIKAHIAQYNLAIQSLSEIADRVAESTGASRNRIKQLVLAQKRLQSL